MAQLRLVSSHKVGRELYRWTFVGFVFAVVQKAAFHGLLTLKLCMLIKDFVQKSYPTIDGGWQCMVAAVVVVVSVLLSSFSSTRLGGKRGAI